MTIRVQIQPDALSRLTGAAVLPVMRDVAVVAERELKLILSTPGRGREVPRGKTAVHRVSRPGDPPAPDTGTLRSRVSGEVRRTGVTVSAVVIANTSYALGLDLGTERIAPRPFRAPLITRIEALLPSLLARRGL